MIYLWLGTCGSTQLETLILKHKYQLWGELCKLVYLLTNEKHMIRCHWLNWLLIKILLHILFVFTILITHLEFNFALDIKSMLRKSCIDIYGVLHHRRSKEAFAFYFGAESSNLLNLLILTEVGSIIVAITSYSMRSLSIFIPSKQSGGFYFEKIL